jgi:5-deoxy-D-glucuronate isomerase
MLEEIYVFVDMPHPAFGLQLAYTDGISAAEVEVVRDGDAAFCRRATILTSRFPVRS